eukprot:Gb_00323 [translate_table: standard]
MDLKLRINTKSHLHFIMILPIFLQIFNAQSSSATSTENNCSDICGNIQLRHPFGLKQGCGAFPYQKMLQCTAQRLELRTVSGSFQVKNMDYEAKTLTISDPSMSTCSSMKPIIHQHFSVDPILPPTNNTVLILLNCANTSLVKLRSSELCKNSFLDCKDLYDSCSAFEVLRERVRNSSSLPCCVTDFHALGNRSLKGLQCSHYTSVNGGALGKISPSEWGYGIRLFFGLPDRLPDVRLCDECDKPNGNCGIGLRCICHPHECGNFVLNQRH